MQAASCQLQDQKHKKQIKAAPHSYEFVTDPRPCVTLEKKKEAEAKIQHSADLPTEGPLLACDIPPPSLHYYLMLRPVEPDERGVVLARGRRGEAVLRRPTAAAAAASRIAAGTPLYGRGGGGGGTGGGGGRASYLADLAQDLV